MQELLIALYIATYQPDTVAQEFLDQPVLVEQIGCNKDLPPILAYPHNGREVLASFSNCTAYLPLGFVATLPERFQPVELFITD